MRLLLILFLSLAALCKLHLSQAEMPCEVEYSCSDDSDPVWAVDGNTCLGFLNACHLESMNCDRQNKSLEDLKKVSRAECQNSCPGSCAKDDSPVCGYFDHKKRSFANTCDMEKYSCESGVPYKLFGNGPCSWD